MIRQMAAAALIWAAVGSVAPAQTKKSGGPKSVTYDVTIKADAVYTGTMEMAVDRGKVTGNLLLTKPTEITGKVAGRSKGSALVLDFPFYMTEQKCEGNVKMNITMPAKPGPASGTLEAVGCGREASQPLPGTVELTPVTPKKNTR